MVVRVEVPGETWKEKKEKLGLLQTELGSATSYNGGGQPTRHAPSTYTAVPPNHAHLWAGKW